MGTPLGTDSKLRIIDDSIQNFASKVVDILIENFNQNNLTLGTVPNPKNPQAVFAITESEFENIFVNLYFNGSYYKLHIKSENADSPYKLRIELDDVICRKFPEKMVEDLRMRYDKLCNELFDMEQ